jgi:L-iditol 2-dehydrogenase
VIGIAGAQGEYAEYFVAPEKNCHLLPEGITWPEAGLVDTLAGPIHGFNKVQSVSGSTVAVFGPGPAGLFFCRLAKLRGATRVYLMGTRDSRLEMGNQYGADRLLNVKRDDTVKVIREETGGRGADIVIEAAGSHEALNDGLNILRKAGILLIYGVFGGGPSPVDVMPIQLFEFAVFGSCGLDYPSAIEFIGNGTVPVKELISHTFTLEEIPEAFNRGFIEDRRDNYMKGVVLFE